MRRSMPPELSFSIGLSFFMSGDGHDFMAGYRGNDEFRPAVRHADLSRLAGDQQLYIRARYALVQLDPDLERADRNEFVRRRAEGRVGQVGDMQHHAA